MANKTINGRIINKHDTETNWSKSSFVPLKGEIVVFDVDSTHSYERFKIGDGTTSVNNLPFVGADKVDKVNGKQLSTNDYTTTEKNKLAGIAEGANKTVIDSALSSSSTNPVQNKVVNAAISNLNTLVGDTSVSEQITTAVSTKADASHTHDDRYYTETEIDSKLSGKSDTSHTHSAYVNQNAFSNIKVGNTTVAADTTTDTVTLVAGNNVTLTPDATNDKITIAATDTVYTHPSSGVTAGTYKSVTVNAQGHVTAGSNPTTLSGYGITDAAAKSHSHNNATTSAAGFMSATDKSTLDSLSGLVGDTSVSAQIAEAIADKVDKVSGKQLSTNDYTTTEKNKLANIASGAEVNQNAFSNIAVGTTTIAADAKTDTLTIAAGSNVTITPDATNDKITIAAKDTVYTHPTYTSKSSGLYKIAVDGTGHVSGTTAVAKSDITALGIPAQDTTYSAATTSTAGLMSASDKSKLDGIATGANKTTVDSSLSSTSTNPVQNKVVNAAISNLNTLVGDTSVASQISTAIADKADADHTHTAADVGADASGAAASALSSAKSYTDTKISNLINGAPTTLDTLGEIAAAMEDNADVVEALEAAVGTKANASDLTSHTGNKSNPHGVTVSQIGAVPTSRTVNGKALSANITLAASDVGADASGAASSALTSAKAYTDSEIAEWVGDTTVSKQISTAVAAKADASHTHSTYVNQNAFSNVIVGSTTVAADSATDTLTLVAGNNVTITPDATNDKITIAATNTVYTHPSYTARTGVPTANQTPAFGGTFTVSQPVSDSTGHITAVNSRTVTIPSTAATTSVAGLMSSSDKTKLDGIATGANKTTVDSALSTTSTNPVQNKIVTASINNLNTLVGDTAVSEQIADAVDDCITGLSVSGKVVTYTKGDGSTGTITTQDTNTTYSAATTSTAGLMSASDKSKLDGITASADAISFSRSLTSGTKVGTITINGTGTDLYAPTNTDTHYTSKNVVGSSTATSNTTSALTNGNVYLNSVENGVVTSAHKISGSGATIVTTDTSGNIVVSSNNTTYSAATTSAAGLMSASDKATLSNLSTLVGDTSVASQISTATASKVDTVTTTGSGNAITAISKSGTTITATKGSTFLTAHPTISKSTDSTSTASPAHGGTFTAVDSITRDSNGHVTKVNTKTITLPADNNTDTKVTQTVTTSNASYPLLLAPSGQTSTATTTSYFDSGVTLNPSTNTIVANISGNAATATKATSDGSGNNIVNTYATKTALNSVSALVGDTAVSTQISNAVASKADTSHTHNYAGSSSAGGAATSANKVNTNLTIKLNGGTTEGTNLFTFNGSAAKTVNITPSAIGAAASSHGTHVSYGTSAAALGTSSAGSATTVSRSDHVHALPALTSCTGTLTVAKGGTGATTQSGAFTNIVAPGGTTTGPITAKGSMYIANNTDNAFLSFIPTNFGTNTMGRIYCYAVPSSTNSYFEFHNFSRSSSDYSRLAYADVYQLPTAAADKTAFSYHKIITTKNPEALDGRWLKLNGGTLTGTTIFKSGLTVKNSSQYPCINFSPNYGDNIYPGQIYFKTGTTTTGLDVPKFLFRQWSPKSSGSTELTSYYEDYYLPATENAKTSSSSYRIYTAKETSQIFNDLSIGNSMPQDADYYICQYTGGGTTYTTYNRRPTSMLWNYINSKLGTSAVGSSSQPIYWNGSKPVACGAIGIANGGTGATNAAGARTNLGIYGNIVKTTQANDITSITLSSINTYRSDMMYTFTAAGTYIVTASATFGKNKTGVRAIRFLIYNSSGTVTKKMGEVRTVANESTAYALGVNSTIILTVSANEVVKTELYTDQTGIALQSYDFTVMRML